MNQRIVDIGDHIHRLESELELEFARRRTELAFTIKGHVVHFEERILKRHRELKARLTCYILGVVHF